MEDNKELILWISELTGEQILSDNIYEILRDGVLLCKIANIISPNSCKYTNSKLPFKHMENISNFLNFASKIVGVPSHELFQTIDLVEGKNIKSVITCLYSLSRNAQKKGIFSGPFIGPKLSEKQTYEFSEEVLLKANATIPQTSGKFVDFTEYTINSGVPRQIGGEYRKASDNKENNK
ncbi:Myophilin [Astathelohania contejeani]|uniref:Myophilin n=1 Tax=Astathelohania contejeani TaxID=164912 RepID=A0ABQ7HXA6_9MICR|nr:Myophilin [Thelohania contejeani]